MPWFAIKEKNSKSALIPLLHLLCNILHFSFPTHIYHPFSFPPFLVIVAPENNFYNIVGIMNPSAGPLLWAVIALAIRRSWISGNVSVWEQHKGNPERLLSQAARVITPHAEHLLGLTTLHKTRESFSESRHGPSIDTTLYFLFNFCEVLFVSYNSTTSVLYHSAGLRFLHGGSV
jgi:hypothetical protein